MDQTELSEALDHLETLWWVCVNDGFHGQYIKDAGEVLKRHGRLSEQDFKEQTTYSK